MSNVRCMPTADGSTCGVLPRHDRIRPRSPRLDGESDAVHRPYIFVLALKQAPNRSPYSGLVLMHPIDLLQSPQYDLRCRHLSSLSAAIFVVSLLPTRPAKPESTICRPCFQDVKLLLFPVNSCRHRLDGLAFPERKMQRSQQQKAKNCPSVPPAWLPLRTPRTPICRASRFPAVSTTIRGA